MLMKLICPCNEGSHNTATHSIPIPFPFSNAFHSIPFLTSTDPFKPFKCFDMKNVIIKLQFFIQNKKTKNQKENRGKNTSYECVCVCLCQFQFLFIWIRISLRYSVISVNCERKRILHGFHEFRFSLVCVTKESINYMWSVKRIRTKLSSASSNAIPQPAEESSRPLHGV